LDIKRTAAAMHLHHNTLRYRLARAEELMGRTLKDPATITSLYIALAYDDPGATGARP
jgi:DNA-binding PucR family transcriptional regulator